MNRCKVEIGEEGIHKEYGSGTIYKITEKNVFVQFEKNREREDSIIRKYLKMDRWQ